MVSPDDDDKKRKAAEKLFIPKKKKKKAAAAAATPAAASVAAAALGYSVGDEVFYAGESKTWEDGDRVVYGGKGKIIGVGSDKKKRIVMFPGNNKNSACRISKLSRTALPDPAIAGDAPMPEGGLASAKESHGASAPKLTADEKGADDAPAKLPAEAPAAASVDAVAAADDDAKPDAPEPAADAVGKGAGGMVSHHPPGKLPGTRIVTASTCDDNAAIAALFWFTWPLLAFWLCRRNLIVC
jgi:hypothetical protein